MAADEFLSIEEAATLLKRSRKAIEHMVERRQLPFRRLGRRILFVREELEAFIEGLPGPRASDVQKRWHR
jgi:excisionase family DNA binding protein